MEHGKELLLKVLPSVDSCLAHPKMRTLLALYPRQQVVGALRAALDELRSNLLQGVMEGLSRGELVTLAVAKASDFLLALRTARLQPVINATGIILHTNLGRAVLPRKVIESISRIGCGYSNLEVDLATGKRGSRQAWVQELLKDLTGAEAALVVNNNAAAVWLCLNTLARDREVIVSRGEQVEIGGSFRIPDVIRQSGAKLVEVGTTNRTHLADYQGNISESTAVLLKVHTSNYRIVGFTASVSREELVGLGRLSGVIVMEDLGSGSLIDLSQFGLPVEATPKVSIAAGVDLVTFSGDKLLGGMQAGLIVGRRELIQIIAQNPLARAVRVDKTTLAALESILSLYQEPERLLEEIPTLKMLALQKADLNQRASKLLEVVQEAVSDQGDVSLSDTTGKVGGGTLPGVELPDKAVAFRPYSMSVSELQARLRLVGLGRPDSGLLPVIAPIEQDELALHVRTLLAGQDEIIGKALKAILRGQGE